TGRRAALPRSDVLVGRLAGVVPRRIAVPEGGSLRRFLRGLETEIVEARPHEHSSLGQIRAWIGASAEAPLFHHVIAAEVVTPDDPLRQLGRRLGFQEIAAALPDPPWPLTVTATLGSRLAVRFAHDARRISPLSVNRLAADLGTLLEAMAAD